MLLYREKKFTKTKNIPDFTPPNWGPFLKTRFQIAAKTIFPDEIHVSYWASKARIPAYSNFIIRCTRIGFKVMSGGAKLILPEAFSQAVL